MINLEFLHECWYSCDSIYHEHDCHETKAVVHIYQNDRPSNILRSASLCGMKKESSSCNVAWSVLGFASRRSMVV